MDGDSLYTPPDVGFAPATEYRYNRDQQLTEVLRPDGQQITLGYDAAGRLASVTTPTGSYGYAYDPSTGTLSRVTAPGGGALSYSYDGSLPLSVRWSGEVSGSVGVAYDDNLWITQQTVNGGDAVSFSYDADGLLTGAGALSITRDLQNGRITGSTLGSTSSTVGYSALGELASTSTTAGGSALFSTSYT